MFDLKKVDDHWTLFLDRDGVINYEKKDGYILEPDEFVFYPGVPEAIRFFSTLFRNIILITNQRGIGKGLMTEDDLAGIHRHMLTLIRRANGRIDKIYHCSAVDDHDPMRKPNPGMALLAKKDFPSIEFSRTIMVGNNISDMLFARNVGEIKSIFLSTTDPDVKFPHPAIDLSFTDLPAFAKALQLK